MKTNNPDNERAEMVSIYGETNPGVVRQNNEDSFICQYVGTNRNILCAAIDGLGGYEGGEIAAEIARSVIIRHVEDSHLENNGRLLKDAFIEANNEIVRQRDARTRISQMGCVVSAALIDLTKRVVHVAHVGDSRIYQLHDGKMIKLTHDHSLVGYREEIGELSEEAAMTHPKRNVVDRYLGERPLPKETSSYIEMSDFPIIGDTQYLFCSDGLTDLVPCSEIRQVLESELTVVAKVQRLIAMANGAGGKDNVTVVIADVKMSQQTGRKKKRGKISDAFSWLRSQFVRKIESDI